LNSDAFEFAEFAYQVSQFPAITRYRLWLTFPCFRERLRCEEACARVICLIDGVRENPRQSNHLFQIL
jgi:hypothetical protein